MSFPNYKSHIIHSNTPSHKRPISIGTLRSTQRTMVPLSQQFELRPTTTRTETFKQDAFTFTGRNDRPGSRVSGTSKTSQYISGKASAIYPMIMFCQKSFRQVLKEIEFDANIKSLRQEDTRNQKIYCLVSELLSEISFTLLNLLVCQHRITRAFFVYFADCELVPVSRCCKAPIHIEVSQVNHGQLKCNSNFCQIKILSVFALQEPEINSLWEDDPIGYDDQDLMNLQISNYITTGRYRGVNLSRQIKRRSTTSKTQRSRGLNNTFYEQGNFNELLTTKYGSKYEDQGIMDELPQIKSPVDHKYSLVQGIIENGKIFTKHFKTQKHVKHKAYVIETGASLSNLEELVNSVLKSETQDND